MILALHGFELTEWWHLVLYWIISLAIFAPELWFIYKHAEVLDGDMF